MNVSTFSNTLQAANLVNIVFFFFNKPHLMRILILCQSLAHNDLLPENETCNSIYFFPFLVKDTLEYKILTIEKNLG